MQTHRMTYFQSVEKFFCHASAKTENIAHHLKSAMSKTSLLQ